MTQPKGSVIPELVRAMLSRPLPMAVSTVGPGGIPQVSLVWQESQADTVVFFADAASHKVTNLHRDPRIAGVVVHDALALGPGVPCYVAIHGEAQIEGRDDALVQRLTARYMNLPYYPFGALDSFLTVRIHPRRFGGNLAEGANSKSQ